MIRTISRVFFSLLAMTFSFVAMTSAQGSAEWVDLEADEGEFSVRVPGGFGSLKEATKVTAYYHTDGVSGSVQRDKTDGMLRLSWIRPGRDDKAVYQAVSFEGFSLIRVTPGPTARAYTETIYIASKNRFYSVTAHGRDRQDPQVRRVLDSIRLKGRPLFRNVVAVPTAARTAGAADLADLKTSPEIAAALKRPDAPAKAARFETVVKTDADDISSTVYTRMLTILRKDKAVYTDDARERGVRGSVHGRVLFRADGTIGEVIMDPSMDEGLARKCAEAARRIKFLPAEVDGKPVDEWRPLTYTFDIY